MNGASAAITFAEKESPNSAEKRVESGRARKRKIIKEQQRRVHRMQESKSLSLVPFYNLSSAGVMCLCIGLRVRAYLSRTGSRLQQHGG